jgi:hypothetical protein
MTAEIFDGHHLSPEARECLASDGWTRQQLDAAEKMIAAEERKRR